MFGAYDFQHLQVLLSDIYADRRIDVRPFGYVFDFASLNSTEIGVATQKIIGNADFVVCSVAFGTLATESPLSSTIQIEDSGSQEKFFNQSTPIFNFASCSNNGAWRGLTFPRRVAGNSTLTATLTAAATLTSPQLYLDGVHVFVYGN